MAKLSLSDVLRKKKRIRLVTAISAILLLFCVVSIIASKNPWGAKAYPSGWDYDSATKTLTVSSGCDSEVDSDNRCLLYGAKIPGYASNPQQIQGIRYHATKTDDQFFEIDNDVTLVLNNVSMATYSKDEEPIKLKNLKITGGAMLTHDKLTDVSGATYNINSADRVTLLPYSSDYQTRTNLWRRIDLQIENSLEVTNGGSISADAKGYPGGAKDEDGWGLGRGTQKSTCGTGNPGAGGSYGGKGGSPVDNTSPLFTDNICPSGATYDTAEHPQLWGSGGAGGKTNPGTAGGGRIKIVANNIIIGSTSNIRADGQSYTASNAGAGMGSGGSIYIKSNYISLDNNSNSNIYARGGNNQGGPSADLYSGSGGGGRIAVYTCSSNRSIALIPMYTDVAAGTATNGAVVGAEGTNYVSQSCSQQVSIKKTLTSISRAGAPYEAQGDKSLFNPYALQKGDVIQVQIDIENLIPGDFRLEEEVLEIKNSASSSRVWCDLNAGQVWGLEEDPLVSYVYNGQTIVFEKTFDASVTSAQITYWCTVKEE